VDDDGKKRKDEFQGIARNCLHLPPIPRSAELWEDEAYPLPDFSKIKAACGWDDSTKGSLEGVEALRADWLESSVKKCVHFSADDDYAELDLTDAQRRSISQHSKWGLGLTQPLPLQWGHFQFEPELAGQHYDKRKGRKDWSVHQSLMGRRKEPTPPAEAPDSPEPTPE